MNKKEDKPNADLVTGLLGLSALGMRKAYHYPRKLCAFCDNPIVGGQGYRFLPKVGDVHTNCLREAEGGRDASKEEAGPAGAGPGVCPEG